MIALKYLYTSKYVFRFSLLNKTNSQGCPFHARTILLVTVLKEFVRIADSQAMVVDLSAEFQGQSKAHYVATLAMAYSNVSSNSRLLFFAEKNPAHSNSNNKQAQVCLQPQFNSC